MTSALTLTRTTIGQKVVVAVTGLILFGFVIGHLAGNLILFAGPEPYIDYAMALKGNPVLLWGVRSVLLVSVVTHIALTMTLARRNATARSDRYRRAREDQITTYAARTMVITGPLLLAYILFHLAHFTAPQIDLVREGVAYEYDHINVYGNLVHGFRVWWVAAIYVFANVMLGLHLFHGAWSALQSVGASHRQYDPLRQKAAIGFALLVAGGNVLIPITVLTGLTGTDAQLREAAVYADTLRDGEDAPAPDPIPEAPGEE